MKEDVISSLSDKLMMLSKRLDTIETKSKKLFLIYNRFLIFKKN
jgi:hypothetical protein